MKITLTFKTPYALEDAAKEKSNDVAEEGNQDDNLNEDGVEELRQETYNKIVEAGKKFVRNGKYIDVEPDTDKGTCTVVKHRP